MYVAAQVAAAAWHPLLAYLPIPIVGSSLSATKHVTDGGVHVLSAWAGLGMLCLYAAVLLGLGGWQLARRDA